MDKIWEPADRVLCGIGRFVLLWPKTSGLFVSLALLITIINNHFPDISTVYFSSPIPVSQAPTHELQTHYPTISQIPRFPIQAEEDSDEPIISTPEPISHFEISGKSTELTDAPLSIQPSSPQLTHQQEAKDPDITNKLISSFTSQDFKTIQVRQGDSLAKIFKRNQLHSADLLKIAHLADAKKIFRNLKPGQELQFQTNAQNQLEQLIVVEKDYHWVIQAVGSGFKISKSAINPAQLATKATSQPHKTDSKIFPVKETKQLLTTKEDGIEYLSGEIQHSLVKDARRAGLSNTQAEQLAQIFSVKNATQKLKTGDTFSVLLQKNASNKKKTNSIVAAQLTHQGKTYQLIHFTTPDGHTDYYTPEGESLHGAGLLRAPLHYERISSAFSHRRLNPVSHIIHAHLGVDYAAPTGTPIKAAGDGIITQAGYNGGYGRSVIIKHDHKYETLYAHLSKFAANLKTGQSVKQGQVIGYVGRSGFATGPHLHYEIHVNKTPNNPLTVALPGKKIPGTYRNQFLAKAKTMLAMLRTHRPIHLASHSKKSTRKS